MKNIFLLLLMAINVVSCTHMYYAPNTANIPLLTEKDEMRINAFYASGSESKFRGGELQVAYALKKNWGVMLNGFTGGRTENTGSYDEKGHGTYGEIGLGYSTTFDKNKFWVSEVYAGAGKGVVESDYGMGDRSTIGLTKIFLQPSLGFKSKHVEVGLSSRMGIVNWKTKESIIMYPKNADQLPDLQYVADHPSFFVFEPGFIVRAGGENVKVQTGFTLSNSKISSRSSGASLGESCTFNLGISFRFNTRTK